jgi:pimeloyl-ACP methyl ester carboxylesterase
MRPTAVFVPGAFVTDAEFWWHPVSELLDERGISSRAVDLPSCGDVGPLGDLHDDAAAARQVVDEIEGEGPVIMVGHSYGGMVITEAAADRTDKVRHLVYISGIVPDGWSVQESDYVVAEKAPKVDQREDGTLGEGSSKFKTKELQRLPNTALTDEGLKRVTRQSAASFIQAPDGHAWRDVPSTYILGLNDGEVDRPQLLAQAERCTSLVELPTSHFAHLERPDLVCDVVVGIAEGLGADVRTEVAS